MSWALIAHSAIDSDVSGIMAASADIEGHIIAEETGVDLFIFPDRFTDPGFFLWRGTLEQALTGDGGAHTEVAPEHLQLWIEKNGEPG
jgi:hypothetical protein